MRNSREFFVVLRPRRGALAFGLRLPHRRRRGLEPEMARPDARGLRCSRVRGRRAVRDGGLEIRRPVAAAQRSDRALQMRPAADRRGNTRVQEVILRRAVQRHHGRLRAHALVARRDAAHAHVHVHLVRMVLQRRLGRRGAPDALLRAARRGDSGRGLGTQRLHRPAYGKSQKSEGQHEGLSRRGFGRNEVRRAARAA